MIDAKNDESEGRLLGIGLGDFQTIREYVHLPLGKLTLLFGPNSAGKSAMADALDAAASIWSGRRTAPDKFYTVWEGVEAIARRHWPWREPADDSEFLFGGAKVRIDLWARLQQINAIASPPRHKLVDQFFPSLYRRVTQSRQKRPIAIVARIVLSEEKAEDHAGPVIRLGLTLDLDEQPILRLNVSEQGGHSIFGLDSRDELALNFQHPLLQEDEGTVFDFQLAAEAENSPFRLAGGWLQFVDGCKLVEGNCLWLETNLTWPYEAENETLKFKTLWDFLAEDIGGRVAVLAKMARVPASRHVPAKESLTFLFTESYVQDRLPPLDVKSDERYRELARQLAARQWKETIKGEEEGKKTFVPLCLISGLRINGSEVDLPAFVNRMLSGPLFSDKGYRVAGEVFQLTGGGTRSMLAALATLSLKDSSGRTFDFSDVGSGLGYVLPVLVEGYQSAQSFIEQPELHLHPALQSRLGDALIEMANDGRFLIIETHSEHILLRVLRRIRQTTKGIVDESLRLTPDDVVCLYFDPSPNGPTRIRNLRVTPGGDFMDRWPAGFFDSRDEDLFDE